MAVGYRKLIITIAALAIGAFVQLTDTQADVIIAVALAGIGGNLGEHLGKVLNEAMVARRDRGVVAGASCDPGEE